MTTEFFIKFVLNGLVAGSLYAILAVGLALLYGVLRFVNIAHGEIALIGGFAFYTFFTLLDWPFIPSYFAALGVLFAIILLIEKFTFLPVRDAPTLIPLIISIGLGILLKNILLLSFQAAPRSLGVSVESHSLFNSDIIRITDAQIAILIASGVFMVGLWAMLKYTKMGRAIRAVSENKEVAAILGIPVNRIITITFLISAFFAGTAGILAAFDQNLNPLMGTFFTIKSFAAVILGGIGSIPGAVLGAYIIGLAENILISIPFASHYIPSNYKDAIAFGVLLILLYIRPTGILGSRSEEAIRK